METESQVDTELQNRVLDAMFVFSDLGDGTVKCTIPDQIFTDLQTVSIAGKEYGIYEIPGLEGSNGSSKIIERAVEKFIKGHGSPSWSQVVTDTVEEHNQSASYPKTIYLKK